MRLGAYPCVIRPGTLADKIYRHAESVKHSLRSKTEHGSVIPQENQALTVSERHRHRFEFNPAYRTQMEEK